MKAMLEDMRAERDAWREQAQRLALPKPEPRNALVTLAAVGATTSV
jgi:hypothetical protein